MKSVTSSHIAATPYGIYDMGHIIWQHLTAEFVSFHFFRQVRNHIMESHSIALLYWFRIVENVVVR